MRNAPILSKRPDGPDFYDHGETLATDILCMLDEPEDLKNKRELLPEKTASILETAYKEDGCTDEIKAFTFKQFVRNDLKGEGWKKLETIFNETIEQINEPTEQNKAVSIAGYLLDIYEKLKAKFEEGLEAKSFTGKKVEDTAAGTRAKTGKATGLELDAGTRAKLGYAQVDPKEDIGGRGTNPWPMRK